MALEVAMVKVCAVPPEEIERPVRPEVANVCVAPIKPFNEEIPEPPADEATSQEIPPGAVDDEVNTLPSEPTASVVHVVPEATIKLPVVVARLLMSLIRPGKLKVTPEILNPPAYPVEVTKVKVLPFTVVPCAEMVVVAAEMVLPVMVMC